VLIAGFFAHMCVSTSAREALVRGFEVHLDPEATGTRDLYDDTLGSQSADEARRSALLQLLNMGAHLVTNDSFADLVPAVTHELTLRSRQLPGAVADLSGIVDFHFEYGK
jgi:hypothetical protein